ncbi:Eco29kI family restriction endonuclease [Streptomyces sp. FH025]|uniref:Eco29kI family restriction endonuclease n=1 Tax=Streptomyces sp. FH025 TaxID=2815937 RepID=UPI001A9E3DF4|nr:Eco29kI family restriction endonuclease [Streptomyces sp. FH025]MBO1414619.1 Eco29kI family restriction endonuclease [Streptomyces sp. FH025]
MTQAARLIGQGTYHDSFRLSITKALGDQLAEALDCLTPAPLTAAALEELEERPGVYQLHRESDVDGDEDTGFVYVGKAEKSLPQRILKHLRKVSGRQGVSQDEMFFTCLYVDEDFSALAPEKLLIKHYKQKKQIPWNNNGFGNNDPGKRRDDTVVSRKHFDAKFPIDLDRVITGLKPGPMPLGRLLARVSKDAPYTFRYQKKETGNAYKAEVELPLSDMTVAQLFSIIAAALPDDWQIAVLPGRVIMYPDGRRDYPSVWRYYRGTQVIDVQPEIDENGEIPEEDNADGDETE